jgi:CheY-like chemotaxis protein
MKVSLPVYRHPTSVVLVDDSASFLASLEFQMNPGIAVKSFHCAQAALRWLDETQGSGACKTLPIRVGYDEQTLSLDRRTIALDVDQIYRLVMNQRRFEEAAVIVIDYAMPQMNGIDFCRALKQLQCKKILFTGEANEKVAVDAFNAGLIDRFVRKSDPNALDRLEVEIATLETQYFAQKSDALKELLVRHSFSFLSDPIFAELVHDLSIRHGFVEHFLFSNPAGMLFVTGQGRPVLMAVETREGMVSHLESAQDYGAPQALQKALRDVSIVPFFWKSGGMYTEASHDWRQYCRPAHRCSGREDYFWALFDLPSQFLDKPVYPYHRFLRDRAPGQA